jgi:hypothetical protein
MPPSVCLPPLEFCRGVSPSQAAKDLFSAIIGVRVRTGRAIYLTPRSAIARIEIFEAAAKAHLEFRDWNGNEDHQKKMANAFAKSLSIISRAKSAVGKRHGIIHDQWGLDEKTRGVMRKSLPAPKKTDGIVPLSELKSLIKSIRSITTDAISLTVEFIENQPHMDDLASRKP